jgi:hypothetical protein
LDKGTNFDVLMGLWMDYNLIEIIVNTLLKGGELTKGKLFKKLMCFGVDGVMYFKGQNRNHNATQGFIGVIFYGCSLCCSYGKLNNRVRGGLH